MNAALDLSHFYGSGTFFRFGFAPNSVMTEGVRYVVENLGALWLVQDIDMYIRHELEANGVDTSFIVARLKPVTETTTHMAELELKGDDNVLFTKAIEFTDFDFSRVPDDFQIWAAPNDLGGYTLYLPSEH